MLKGLLTRKAFVVIDVVLTGLVLLVLFLVAKELTWKVPASSTSGVDTTDVAVPQFASVKGRGDYDVIVTSRLFGDAGAMEAKVEAAPPPPPVTDTVEQTKFNLKLVAATLTKPYPNAYIENLDTQESKVYWPGDEVIPARAKLKEVRKREVVLLNLEKNQTEYLRMDPEAGDPFSSPAGATRSTSAPPPPPLSNPNSINISREEIAQELENLTTNMAEISNTLNPRPYQDASGRTIGYTADNISSVPLARRMGLQDGDVVTQINGIEIDSMQKITDVIGRFENSPTFHIKVLRQGKPMLLQYRMTE